MKKRNIFFRYSDQAVIMHLIFNIPKKAWEGIRSSHIKNWFPLFLEPLFFYIKWAIDCMGFSVRALTKVRMGRLSTGLFSVLYCLWIFTIANIDKTWEAYGEFLRQIGLALWALFSFKDDIDWYSLFNAAYVNIDSEALQFMMVAFTAVSMIHLGCIYSGKFTDPDSVLSRGTSISYYMLGEKVPFLSERFYDFGWDIAATIIVATIAFYQGDLTFAFFIIISAIVIFVQELFENIDRSGTGL